MKYFAAHTDALQRHQVYLTAVSTSFQTWNTRGVFVGCAPQKHFVFPQKFLINCSANWVWYRARIFNLQIEFVSRYRIFDLEIEFVIQILIVIQSADQIFGLQTINWSAYRIFDLEIIIRFVDRIFNLKTVIRSTDWIFDLEIELDLQIEYSISRY